MGISLGVSRLLTPLLADGLRASRSVPSAVLVALPDEASRDSALAVAAQLRSRGIPTELAPVAAKFGKQIRHAERRGIPYVWFPGEPQTVKDIRTGEQTKADPAGWAPPPDDLRPQVVHPTVEETPT